ncbi:MAG: 16S rRNA (uracil(1498)-N(3))-methyltransferase [Pseudomonadota bacterium]
MTRLFVPDSITAGSIHALPAEQARYLGKVLRMKTGDELAIFNGDCGEWCARIVAFTRNSATLEAIESRAVNVESPLQIWLVQGISRGDRMDTVVQKATELGVTRITPVLTHRGTVKLDGSRREKRREHFQAVANSACEQSGRTTPPQVDSPVSLNDWFGQAEYPSARFVLDPRSESPLSAQAPPSNGTVCLLVGPEGGFSEREEGDAAVAGFSAVSLGPRVLRTETAAIATMTAAQLLWGDFQS